MSILQWEAVAVSAQIAVVILLVVILRWMVFWTGLRKCVGRNKSFFVGGGKSFNPRT